jgi:hypothetical protein
MGKAVLPFNKLQKTGEMMRQTRYVLLLAVICAPAWAAQWMLIDASADLPTAAAIRNSDGHALRVYRDAQDHVRMRFLLHAGFDNLAACPTFQVHDKAAEQRSFDNTECDNNGQWAEYTLGQIEKNAVQSMVLHRLLNGGDVAFRYALKDHGYGETVFSLGGSKQVITRALGGKIKITPE